MPILNFRERFAPMVESGQKRQTIRRVRKRPIKVGDRLYLYTGLRTPKARKLGEAECCSVSNLTIAKHAVLVDGVFVDAMWLGMRDGFETWYEMREWFRKQYGLPFDGILIRWGDLLEGRG